MSLLDSGFRKTKCVTNVSKVFSLQVVHPEYFTIFITKNTIINEVIEGSYTSDTLDLIPGLNMLTSHYRNFPQVGQRRCLVPDPLELDGRQVRVRVRTRLTVIFCFAAISHRLQFGYFVLDHYTDLH